jgi:hypothetical protein
MSQVILFFLPFIFLGIGSAFGYVENIHLETENGEQIFASATNPSTVTAPIGFIHGTLQVSSVPILDSTLKDFVNSETSQADNTTQVIFDGIVVPNQTSIIRVLDASGNIVYSMVIQPKVDQVISIPKSAQFGDFNFIYVIIVIGGVAGCGTIGFVWWKKQGEED